MSLFFVRGPQRDESNRFEIIPSERETDVNQTFSRESTFYQEKSGNWGEKKCQILLGYYTLDKWVQTGILDLNMGPFVGKGECHKDFDFNGQTATENAKVHLTFLIEPKDSGALANHTENLRNTEVPTSGGGYFKKLGGNIAGDEMKEKFAKGQEAFEKGKEMAEQANDAANQIKELMDQLKELQEALKDKDAAMELLKSKGMDALTGGGEEGGDGEPGALEGLLSYGVGKLTGAQAEVAASLAQSQIDLAKANTEIGTLTDLLTYSRTKLEVADAARAKAEAELAHTKGELFKVLGGQGSSQFKNEGYF